ncbi:MAG: hypothetical protein WCQ64_08740 [Acidobacteriota bacterium]
MARWRALLSGAAAFLLAHIIERARWTTWFTDAQSLVPWFTNSGRAVGFTVACVFVAALLSGRRERDRDEWMWHAAYVSGGSVAALVVALIASDAGTIAPLVVIVGGALVTAGAYAGSFVVRALSVRR